MPWKLNELDPKLRARIESQMRAEDAARLGQLQGHVAEQAARPLVGSEQAPKVRRTRVARSGVKLRVAIIGFRHRILDDDNFRGGCKVLRDAISAWLGCSDSDKLIAWEYSQCQTSGIEGTAVRICLGPNRFVFNRHEA